MDSIAIDSPYWGFVVPEKQLAPQYRAEIVPMFENSAEIIGEPPAEE